METFRQDLLEAFLGHPVSFLQDNESLSRRGTLRGLHYQIPPAAQSKLVRVVRGRIYDVAVDIRRGSPTFGRYVALELSASNRLQLYIPAGFAHGFLVLEDDTLVSYKVDALYSPEHERGISYDDPQIAIPWPLPPSELLLSPKDRSQPRLAEARDLFERTGGGRRP
jgi:dTDP-4-dehydrorhamnose 3,5-epimerase